MYNGIGLQTPRGSGTNGHVQRNWALVKPSNKEKLSYHTEEDLSKLDAASNRQPNQEILNHERKRKIELKCVELEEILEEKGYSKDIIESKVDNYRKMLMGYDVGGTNFFKDDSGRISVTETHQIAEAQQQKNARLREAFGISDYYVDGSSFDPARETKEATAKAAALREQEHLKEQEEAKRYELVHTPSPEPNKKEKKKRKKKDDSSSEELKKKKKGKKHKKERSGKSKEKKKNKKRKRKSTATSDSEDNSSSDESSDSSSEDEKRKKRKKKKEKKRLAKKKHRSSSESSRVSSPEPPTKKLKNDSKSEKSKDIDNNQKFNKNKERKYDEKKHSDFEKSEKRTNDQGKGNSKRRSRSLSSDRRGKLIKDKHKENKTRYSPSPKRYESKQRKSSERRYKSKYSRSPKSRILSKNRISRSRSNSKNRRNHRDTNSDKYDNKHKNCKRTYSPTKHHRQRSNSPQNKRSKSRSLPVKKSRQSKSREKSYERFSYKKSKRSRSRQPEKQRRSRSNSVKQKSLNKNRVSLTKRSFTPSPKYKSRKPSPKRDLIPKVLHSSRKRSPYKRPSKSPKNQMMPQRKLYRENISNNNRSRDKKYSDSPRAEDRSYSPKKNKNNHIYSDDTILEAEIPKKSKSPIDEKSRKFKNKYRSISRSRSKSINRSQNKKTLDKSKDRISKDRKNSCHTKSPTNTPKHVIIPVVRLRSSSEEPVTDNENDQTDEEKEKEFTALKLLYSNLATKAKETLEKKIPKPSPDSQPILKSPEKYDHFDIPSINLNLIQSPPPKVDKIIAKAEIPPIKLLPLKKPILSPEPKLEKGNLDVSKGDIDIKLKSQISEADMKNIINWENTEVKKETRSFTKNDIKRFSSSSSRSRSKSDSREKSFSKDRKSRSSSKSSYSSERRSPSSSSSSRSRSRSHSRSLSRSGSRSRSRSRSFSSSSSSSSRSNSRSRSPSIPRRHGSPSFLDRRRITSARKRPIPYHRPTPSSPSSVSSWSSKNSSPWYAHCTPNRGRSESISPVVRNQSSRSQSTTPTYNR